MDFDLSPEQEVLAGFGFAPEEIAAPRGADAIGAGRERGSDEA